MALLKCCRIFYNLVKVGDIYEDEEFCDYERYPGGKRGPRLRLVLGDNVDDAELYQLFDRVLAALQNKSDCNENEDTAAWRALEHRIDHRCSYFATIALLRPLAEALAPDSQDEPNTIVDATHRVRRLVASQLQSAATEMKKVREFGDKVMASLAHVWTALTADDTAEAVRAEAEAKAAADKKKLESDRPQGVEEGVQAEDTERVLERASITKTGKLRYGIDQASVKEFLPAGPPRKMTELVVPSKAYQILEEHLSHLEFVCACHSQVVSCTAFEACQMAPADAAGSMGTSKSAGSAAPRCTTTLTQMHDYLEDFVERRADLFARSVMVLLISGPLTRATAPVVPPHDLAAAIKTKDGAAPDMPPAPATLTHPALLLGRDILSDVVCSSLLEYGVAPWMLKNEPFGIESGKHILPVTTNEMRLYCLAPARLHRRINRVLHEWGEVQQEVDYLDSAMLASVKITGEATRTFANRFGSWVLDRAMGLMVRQLLLGFQLDLYAEQEYVAVYWYCDRIAQMRIQNRNAARKAYFERELGTQPDFGEDAASDAQKQGYGGGGGDDGFGAEVLMVASGGKGNKKGKKNKKTKKGKNKKKTKNKKNKLHQSSAAGRGDGTAEAGNNDKVVVRLSLDMPRHDRHIHLRALNELDMHRTLFRSYACVLIVLRHFKYLNGAHKYALGSDALRFQHRFQQFQHFNQPSPIRYEEFAAHVCTVEEKGAQILAMVKNWFSYATQQSKKLLSVCPYATKEFQARVRKVAKLCVINGIALQTLMRSGDMDESQSTPPSVACAIAFKFAGTDANCYFPLIHQVRK